MSGVSALLRGTPESHHVRLGDKGRLRTRQHPPLPPPQQRAAALMPPSWAFQPPDRPAINFCV